MGPLLCAQLKTPLARSCNEKEVIAGGVSLASSGLSLSVAVDSIQRGPGPTKIPSWALTIRHPCFYELTVALIAMYRSSCLGAPGVSTARSAYSLIFIVPY
jgi:hypothetical protein